jgi:restriction endonuclease S subunit
MIDMFGGSGGFTTGYINYLNNNFDIDWKNNINKIYHFDMNEDVVKSAGLEFFCLSGVLPNMKDNLAYKNSFTDEFHNKKFMYVITNPPYGGDKIVQTDAQIKRKKIKDYIKKELETLEDETKIKIRTKQLKNIENQEKQDKKESDKTKVSIETCSQRIIRFAKKYKLSGNDKESSSLILIMDLVDTNGTAVGVLKEGVFFNKTYKDIRKCLIENYNVREIISVPQDQFENTSTKTSIVIFNNTEEKTSTVKFSELIVERYTEDKYEEINDEIVLTENKNDISGISDKLISEATKEEILKNSICSLNGKDYNKKEIKCGKEYELVKLGDVCKCLTTTKHCTNIAKINGKFKFYNSSQNSNLYVDFCEVKEYSIILGQGGNFNIHFDKDFTPSKHVCVLQSINNDIKLLKYFYYIIPELQKHFITNGSTISWLNKTNIKDFNIPIPKSKEKITEWCNKISISYDKKNENEKLIIKLEEQIRDKIRDIGENEECDEVELGSICEIYSGSKTNLQSYLTNISPYKIIRTRNLIDSNDYLYLNTEGIDKCKTKLLNKGDILMSSFTDSYVCKIIPDDFIGSTFNGGLFKISNLKLNSKYFVKYINSDIFKTQVKKISGGSTVLLFNIDNLKKIKIHIPKNKSLIDNLNPLFQEIERLQMELKEAETLYKQLINELSEEAIPSNIKKQNTEIKEDSGTVVQIKTEEIIEQPKKKIIKFKKAENSEIIEQPKKNNKKEEITESIKKKTTVKKVKTEQLSL